MPSENRFAVDLIRETTDRGAAVLGIFHNEAVATRIVDLTEIKEAA